MKFLVVDDTSMARKSLKGFLEQKGHSCTTACNSMKAWGMVQKEKFDVVVTDFKMPQMNGIELLKKIRSSYPKTDVLIFTGYADVGNAIDAVNFGAYAFFRKPLDMKDFTATIEKLEKERVAPSLDNTTPEDWKEEYSKLETVFKNLRGSVEHLIKTHAHGGYEDE